MKKRKKSFLYILMTFLIVINITPIFASSKELDTYDTITYTESSSTFKIIIPKEIIINNKTKIGTYTVKVEGNIENIESIKIIPDSSFVLYSKNLNDITASIIQDKTEWTNDNFTIAGNGKIDASGISAGKWNGTFNFNINLINKIETPIILEPGAYNKNDVMLASWDELINTYGLNLNKNYTDSNYATDASSVYYILNNNESLKETTKIIMGNGIAFIGDYAFKDCNNLTTISIPEGIMSMGYHAFENCSSLTDIIIPKSMTNIGEYAFQNCNSLTNIIIPNGTTGINRGLFKGCNKLTTISIPNSIISINEEAFAECYELSHFEIPISVTTIGSLAFTECYNLTNITIPDSITSIGQYAFSNYMLNITWRETTYTDKTELNNAIKSENISTVDVWQN